MSLARTLKVIYQDRLAAWLTNISILAMIATWLLFLLFRLTPDPVTVLHYNIYAGIDIIGDYYWIYIFPGIVLALSILNFIIANFFWTRQRVWSYFLLATILVSNATMFLYLYNILNYNS